MNALYILLQVTPSWQDAVTWIRTYAAELVIVPSAFAGMLASIPFVRKAKEDIPSLFSYGFTSWSTAVVIGFAAVETSDMGFGKAMVTAFVLGIGGFNIARRIFNQSKDPVKGVQYWKRLNDKNDDPA